MKKISIYLITCLTLIVFTACNEDFDDWADPQTNEQEDPKSASFQLSNVLTAIDLNTITADSIEIAKIASTSVEEGGQVSCEVFLRSDAEFSALDIIPSAVKDNVIKVATSDLEDVAWLFYGKEGKENPMVLRIDGIVSSTAGQAIRVQNADISLTVTTKTLPIEESYYMIGAINNWTPSKVIEFTKTGDGLFELIVDIPDNDSMFKIVPQSGVDAGGQAFWDSALGVKKGNETFKSGTLDYKRNGIEPEGIIIASAGEVKIKLNMNDYTYKVGPVFEIPESIYIIGSPWGWTWDNVDKSMVPVNGLAGKFWIMQYLAADAEIKFFPEKDWVNGFGFAESEFTDGAVEYADLSDSGGNVKVGKAGWYIIIVEISEDGEYTLNFVEPTVWLVGEVSNGGWASIATDEKDKFTTPDTEDGEFVSPEFVNDGNLRMAVSAAGIDWWRTEFNIIGGEIVYRTGNELEAVPVTSGQKAYLKFSDNTGKIQ